MKPFLVHLDPAVLARLQAAAEATSTSIAQVIRVCVKQALPAIEDHIKRQQEAKS